MNFKNKWIVVTGASSGLGREMAVQFAKKHKANLILVARRQEKLEALREQLIADYGVQCETIVADLTKAEDVDNVFSKATQMAKVYGVVLNAGVTYFGEHTELAWDYFETMLATNVTSLVKLTHLFVPYLEQQYRENKKHKGGMMYVASMAGLTPIPYQAAYAGTKAFIINFGMSLQHELKKSPVSLTVFAPGGIDTELTRNSGLDYFSNSGLLQSAEACAIHGIRAFKRGKALYVPGKANQVQVALTKLVPRKVSTMVTGRTYKVALDKQK